MDARSLRYVPGEPLPRAAASAALAGEALGRAHAVLLRESRRNWVPANLVDWFESRGAPPVAAVRDLDRLGLLTWAVVYGDPSPEVLVGESGGLGLIDWGTPSWGPLLHDVACWTTFFRVGRSRGAFLAAYRRWVPLRDEELVALPVFRALTRTLHG